MIPYLNVTARWDGAPDQDMLQPKGGRGFPYCTLMNSDGDVVWEVRPTSEDVFKEAVQHARQLVSLQEKLAESPEDKVVEANHALLDAIGRSQRPAPDVADLAKFAEVEGVDPKILEAFEAWRSEKLVMAAIRKPDMAYELFRDSPPQGLSGALGIYFHLQAAMGAIEDENTEVAKKARAVAQELADADEEQAKRFKRLFDQVDSSLDG